MQRRFARRSHRSGVIDVFAHVRAVIDAGDHQVGLLREQFVQRHNHRVGRSSFHRPVPFFFAMHHDRPPQRQRLRRAALFCKRRNNAYRRKILQRRLQRAQSFRAVPIVICEENIRHLGDCDLFFPAPPGFASLGPDSRLPPDLVHSFGSQTRGAGSHARNDGDEQKEGRKSTFVQPTRSKNSDVKNPLQTRTEGFLSALIPRQAFRERSESVWQARLARMNWSGRPDLNRGPHAPQACALPDCATPRQE